MTVAGEQELGFAKRRHCGAGRVGHGAWRRRAARRPRRAALGATSPRPSPTSTRSIGTRLSAGHQARPGDRGHRAASTRLPPATSLLMVTPAQHLRAIAGELAPYMRAGQPLVICAKGIEQSTGKLCRKSWPRCCPQAEIAVLSGPSFAAEIASGLPAAVTLAAASEAQGRALAHALSHASVPLLLERRRDRRRDRRRAQERLCHRRRHRRRQEARRERARRARHARLRRDGALRRGARRAARDA